MDIYVQKHGQQQGPFPENRIRQGLDAGEFVAADLAWMKGKASWQPLASLINLDVTKPPPISGFSSAQTENGTNVPNVVLIPDPVDRTVGENEVHFPPALPSQDIDEAGQFQPNTDQDAHPELTYATEDGETVLFRDAEDFEGRIYLEGGLGFGHWGISPQVLVTSRRFKAGNESHSLQGARNVSLVATLHNDGVGKAVQAGLLALAAMIMVCPAFTLTFQPAGVGTTSSWLTFIPFLALLWAIPVVLLTAMNRAWTRHARLRFWEAVIILSGAQGSTRIVIAIFNQYPVSEDRWILRKINEIEEKNIPKIIEERQRYYDQSVARTQAILKAIERSIYNQQSTPSQAIGSADGIVSRRSE